MTKEFRKSIYSRSRLRNKFCKVSTEENEKYTRNKEMCLNPKTSIRNYFNKIANGNNGQLPIVTNRNFGKIIKPFLSNKEN